MKSRWVSTTALAIAFAWLAALGCSSEQSNGDSGAEPTPVASAADEASSTKSELSASKESSDESGAKAEVAAKSDEAGDKAKPGMIDTNRVAKPSDASRLKTPIDKAALRRNAMVGSKSMADYKNFNGTKLAFVHTGNLIGEIDPCG